MLLKYFTKFVKIDFRFRLHLETKMKRLFESRKVITGSRLTDTDAKIIFTKVPFIQYEQILLDKNFRQYLEAIMISKKN